MQYFFCMVILQMYGSVCKAEHRFPCIDDEHNNRFVKLNDENKAMLEELLQGKILFTRTYQRFYSFEER